MEEKTYVAVWCKAMLQSLKADPSQTDLRGKWITATERDSELEDYI